MDFPELLAQPKALPSAPTTVARLIQSFSNDQISLGDVIECMEADPAIVVKLLHMVNSPFFFRGHVVGSVGDAVRRLGMTQTRSLVIGLIAKDCFPLLPSAYLDQFWRFSLTTAELARSLARQCEVDGESAYIGALLHEIGALVMRAAMAEEMVALDRICPPMAMGRAEAEHKVLGYTYADVGAALARQWHLPPRVVTIIETQHMPRLNMDGGREAALVFLSAWRASAIEMKLQTEAQASYFSSTAATLAEALKIDPLDLMKWTPAFDRTSDA